MLLATSSRPHLPDLPLAVGMVVANVAVVAVVLTLERTAGVDSLFLIQDPNRLQHADDIGNAWRGALTYVGGLAWATGAVSCLLAASMMRPGAGAPPGLRGALVLLGVYMAAACLDDLFQIHEQLSYSGIPEKVSMAPHALAIIAILVALARLGSVVPWATVALSMAFLAASTLVDLLELYAIMTAEEMLKLAGVTLLAAAAVTLSRRALRLR